MKRTVIQNRKYYLHRRVKTFARLVLKLRTIYVPFNFESEFTKKQRAYIAELQNYHYTIQTEIR